MQETVEDGSFFCFQGADFEVHPAKIIQTEVAFAKQQIPSIEKYSLQPNKMQVGFITNLRKIIASGEDRALLISATGASGIIMTSQAKTA